VDYKRNKLWIPEESVSHVSTVIHRWLLLTTRHWPVKRGAYRSATGETRGGQPTPVITHGFNKDHRPDLKQLLYILTISADGAVPIAYRSADGNTVDDVTHIETWDSLVSLVGSPDFTYVADSKLCSAEAMGHIARLGGRFVTIIPHGRKEDTWFRGFAQTHVPAWEEAYRRKGARQGDPDEVWRTFVAPAPSTEGYRVIWVHSSAKAGRDANTLQSRIEAGLRAIDSVAERILEIFGDAQRHHLVSKGEVVQDFDPELTPLHLQVLDLLHVPASVYASSSAS